MRRALAAIAAAALAVTLAGCSGAAARGRRRRVRCTTPLPTTPPHRSQHGRRPARRHDRATRPRQRTSPTGPPCRRATRARTRRAPTTPTATSATRAGARASNAAKTSVPPTAVLDTETVAEVAGGDWTASAAPADHARLPAHRSSRDPLGAAHRPWAPAAGSRLAEVLFEHAPRGGRRSRRGARARTPPDRVPRDVAADPRIGDASVQAQLTAPGRDSDHRHRRGRRGCHVRAVRLGARSRQLSAGRR